MKSSRKRLVPWIVLIALAIAIKFLSFHPGWVEQYYVLGIYPLISSGLRYLFGWLPFSIGDILYGAIIVWFIYQVIKAIRLIRKEAFTRKRVQVFSLRIVFAGLLVYVLFYGLWGLNYSRAGIASQLGLKEVRYTVYDLDTLVSALQDKLNANARLLTPAMRDSFKAKKKLFANAALMYKVAETRYPFLSYKGYSVKPSIFSYLGNYLGFQGYYNPFTGEAQVNTTIPLCSEPFVASHEIAHQLGYAKESEANFVGFLACRLHPSVNFKYSVYFDMYHYAIRELRSADSLKAKVFDSSLHKQVKKDVEEYRAFYRKYRNPIEPYIDRMYSYFLKVNNQPKGKESYNEVVTWLIAYYKKYGREAI